MPAPVPPSGIRDDMPRARVDPRPTRPVDWGHANQSRLRGDVARPGTGRPVELVGRLLPPALDVGGVRAEVVVRGGVRGARAGRRDRRHRQPGRLVGALRRRATRRQGRPHRLAPRLGPRRWGVRRTAGRGVRARRRRRVAGPGLRAGPPDRHRRLRRGGGLAVRARLPRLAAGRRRHDVGAGAGAARPRRRLPRRRDQRRRAGPCAGAAGPRPRRHLRRAPRRAGP